MTYRLHKDFIMAVSKCSSHDHDVNVLFFLILTYDIVTLKMNGSHADNTNSLFKRILGIWWTSQPNSTLNPEHQHHIVIVRVSVCHSVWVWPQKLLVNWIYSWNKPQAFNHVNHLNLQSLMIKTTECELSTPLSINCPIRTKRCWIFWSSIYRRKLFF